MGCDGSSSCREQWIGYQKDWISYYYSSKIYCFAAILWYDIFSLIYTVYKKKKCRGVTKYF